MKKIIAIALGVLCIATFAAPSPHAAGQYPIVIETNGDAASVMAYAPQHRAIHMTAYVPAYAARSYALALESHGLGREAPRVLRLVRGFTAQR